MAQAEYYDLEPADRTLISAKLRPFIDGLVGHFLAGETTSQAIQFLFKNFGPAETANNTYVLSQKEDGNFYLDNSKIVIDGVGQAAITDAITSAIMAGALAVGVTASSPIAIEVAAGAASAIVWQTFAEPVVGHIYEIFNVASTKLEITNSDGTIGGGVVYRNGLSGITPLKAAMDLLSWSATNATKKFGVGSHVELYVNSTNRLGFDVLALDVLTQISQALGISKSDIENRADGIDANGELAKNIDLLSTYLAPNGTNYNILESSAQLSLRMSDANGNFFTTFSKDRMSFGGDLNYVDLTKQIAAFGTSGSDNLDFGGATGQVFAYGGDGSDTIRGGTGDDRLWGDSPTNTTAGSIDFIYGGAGDDQIFGGAGDDQLFGQDGRDLIRGGTGNDTIDGGAGLDTIWGGLGADTIHGGSDDDLIQGGSDIPQENDTATNILYGDAGNDIVFGAFGDDTLSGGAGNDYLDGGLGTDTALYDDAGLSQTIEISGGGAAPEGQSAFGPGSFLTLKRGSEVDVLHSIEKLDLSSDSDTVKVVSGADLTGLEEIDAEGGKKDIFDAEQYDGKLELVRGHLIGDGIDIMLINFEKVILPNWGGYNDLIPDGISDVATGDGNDVIRVSAVSGGDITGSIDVDAGGGSDTVSVKLPGVTVDLGAGDDTLKLSAPGTIVHTGDGNDKIEASHNGQLLIEDASSTDRITYYGSVLTGGVQWGVESKYAYGIHGERYGRNAQGNLVIIDAQGNETFLPGFNFTTDASSNLTAGLFVIQVTYQIERSNGWTAGFETAASAVKAMKKIAQALTGVMRSGTDPLVLDLNGNGVSLSSIAGNSASFDVDKDGFAERVGWVRGGDGILVRDLNGNGKIDDIGEMFGNDQTSGFTQLATLDGNHDGKISADDNGLVDFNGDGIVDASDTFDTLKVWVDDNEDGKTDADELKSLAELNIVSIGVGSTASTTVDSGNTIAATGTFERGDGTTGTVGEVQFDTDNTNTTWLGDSSVSAEAATRPDMKGFGTLTDLHVAMTLHPDLIATVDAALPSLNTLSLASLRDAARTILYAWAGAVPVPEGTPGTETTHDFWFVGDVTRTGGVAYDFLVKKGEWAPEWTGGTTVHVDPQPYYGYASGQYVYNADKTVVYDHPTIDMVLASPPVQGSWNKLTAQDIAFLERYTGVDLGFVISENPSADAIQVIANGLTASWNELNRLAVRLAAQGPLAPFFAGITYDVTTDTFRPTTEHQLVPMLEAIFHAAPATASGAQDYLAQWHDIINVVLPDFQRDNDGHQLTDAFLFQNLVGAYEDVPLAISLQQAASIFDIPAAEIKTGSGTLVGDDNNTDLFYLDSSNQVLQGHGGSDAYIVGYNFGHDVIQDVWQGLGQNQEDSIWFAHLNASDLTFTRDGLDLLITQNGTDNQIRVVDEFAGRRPGLVTAFQDFDKQIEIFKFADGTTWDQLDLARVIGMPSYATDDTLMGTPDVDFLNGGAGTDYMSGGDGGDHYFFGRGYGHDTIEDREVWVWGDSPDYVHFGAGITEDDVTFQRVGVSDDLQVTINGTNDVLTVTGQFGVAYGLLDTQQDRIEYFTFDDGSYIGWEDIIKSIDAAAGTSGDDVITGFSYDDVLDGGAGNDFLTGGNGNDTYVFGRGYGSDTIEDRLGYILSGTVDTVQFKAGISLSDLTFHHDGNTSDLRITINGTDDSLKIIGEFSIVYGLIATMDDRIENFTFADGTVLGWHDILLQIDAAAGTDGNDTIYGFNYDDTLAGGKGDDYLSGGAGNDTYVYSRGDGHDTIYDLADAQGPEFDTLVLHGINPADVSLVANGTDVTLVFAESALGAGDGGSVLLQAELDDWFAQGIEQITFDDGTVWTQSDLRVKVLATESTPGNDTIVGFNTNDVIEGGRGDDTISGGAGDDTYIYTRGDGNDSIAEVWLGNYSSFDTLKLHDIAPSAISLVRNGNDLTLVIAESAPGAGDGGSILLKSELGGAVEGVEQIVFDDNTLWTKDDLRLRVLAEAATDGNDTINGFDTNDTLRGGKGDDILYGWAGDDTYIYSRGDGNDTIYEVWLGNYSSFDTLKLQNIAPSAVQLVRSQNDLRLVVAESSPGAGDGGSILLKDELTGGAVEGVEQIIFDDGTTWTQAQLREMVLAQEAASADTAIYGFGSDDTIFAGAADRSLYGAGGRDTYVYSSSGGNVVVVDPGNLQSILQFADVNSMDVTLSRPVANGGADLVITVNSTGKTVTVRGEFSNSGGALRGISFADGAIWNPDQVKSVLAGQSAGGYHFNRGDGQVTLGQSTNTVLLGAGITPDDIILQANQRNLTVSLRGTGDSFTILDDLTQNTWGVSSLLSKLQFSDGTSLAVGQPSAGHGLPLTFTWLGAVKNYWITGSSYGSNVFEITVGDGTVNFTSTATAGSTNLIEYVKGAGNVGVNLNGGRGAIAFGSNVAVQDVYLQANSSGALSIKFRNDLTDGISIPGDLTSSGGIVTSAISQLQFSDGSVINLGGTGNTPTFNWLGNSNNYYLTGVAFGTNVYEITAGSGSINFTNNSAVGGTNIIKYAKGTGYADVQLNGGTGILAFDSNVSAQDVYLQSNSNGNGDLFVKFRNDVTDGLTIHFDLTNNAGVVTSAISQLKFSDGSTVYLGGPGNLPTFTWFGNTSGYTINGANLGTNVYELSTGGKVNFGNNGAVGGTNIVKFDKGDQNVAVEAAGFAGELDLGANISVQDVYWQTDGYGDLILKIRGDDADSINAWRDLVLTNGVVTSAIKTVRFSDGSTLDMSHGPSTFTWIGSAPGYTINGSNLGTNVYELSAGGKVNFGDSAASGGTNIVKFDKGDQNVAVEAAGFAGELDLGANISVQDVYWQTDGYGDLILKIRGDDADSVNFWRDLVLTNGVVTSAIKAVKFSDGSALDMSHGPTAFTWIGSAPGYTINGSNLGTNVYELSAGGKVNFGDSAASGGTNIVKFDRGSQNVAVEAAGFAGELDLGANISAQDIYWQTDGYGDLILKIRGDDADSVNFWRDLVLTNGVVTSAIKTVKFSDGSTLDMSHGPTAFTWIGTANGYNLVGSNMRSNVFEIAQGNGAITFGNASNGGDGKNTIRYDIGDGLADVQLNGGKGVITFGSNVAAQDVILQSTTNGDLIVKFRNDSADAITIHNDLVFGNVNSYGISAIQFADGTAWDYTFIASNAWIRGTAGNDSINLPANAATVDAGGGDDTLNVSGTGSDRIVFGAGSGHDVLDNPGNGYQRSDVLDLTGLLPSDVVLSRSGNQLIVKVLSTGDTFTALWQFYDGGTSVYGINSIKFSDGTVWDRATMAANAWVRGTAGNDSITLPATGITADAEAGDDTLTVSGNGSDRIVFAKGYGHDTLTNPGSGYNRDDTLALSDINPWDVQFSRSGDAMTLNVLSTGDSLRVNFQYWGDGSQIQGLTHIQFANGSNWSRSNLLDATSTFTWSGSATNATLTGNDYGSNIFQLGAGGEMAYGGARSNVFQVTSSTGQAQINLSSATGSKNELDFLSGITDQNLWFERAGNDLKIDLLGTNTSTTIGNWFSGGGGALQEITAGGLKIDSQISQLVQAMATYSSNNAGFDPTNSSIQTLPSDTTLQSAVAAAWHA
ncbi:calcium-binding protein [Bradyrhizobium sp. CCGUVB14]|uniref:calcium-binding protein n=1 Tax=Bradyrhizobium sp. CCGUVB14 TaxID=2949628 RepID=UPI0020B4239A|nr:calcium-binding protein [Bradyrhizobium sp. CCGUVB14]MCP3445817.1 calcium-binding protein [Bradyrhizobium sp. CCGUVB14]